MSDYVVSAPMAPFVPVAGGGCFPARRIFCVGKNYSDHVREMGGDAKISSPVFFTKPSDAIVLSGLEIPYAKGTSNLHFEGELVVALKEGGSNIRSPEEAEAKIFGFAAGCDLTRRDLQAAAKEKGAPWDAAKAFDQSAPIGAIMPVAEKSLQVIEASRLRTLVNGEVRQDAALSEMIWSTPEILMGLSQYFELKVGDLIFTGTPAGVGPLSVGDKVEVRVDDLPELSFSIGPKE